ncbi:hypothetical protein [Pseudalgibacter alginicilyticus]|nr:hypothetical protein [Pseudalgibacter alginicilyticus]
MQHLNKFFKSVVQACPYSLVGKKCMDAVKGKPSVNKNSNNKTQLFQKGIKTGRNISLVGVFCPFLWFSILSGATKDFIILNLIHSGIIVGIGLVIMGINYIALNSKSKSVGKG